MKKLSDYSKEQVEHFEEMRLKLEALNQDVAATDEIKLPLPYSKEEIARYSQYCQIKLREELYDQV